MTKNTIYKSIFSIYLFPSTISNSRLLQNEWKMNFGFSLNNNANFFFAKWKWFIQCSLCVCATEIKLISKKESHQNKSLGCLLLSKSHRYWSRSLLLYLSTFVSELGWIWGGLSKSFWIFSINAINFITTMLLAKWQ